MNTTYLLTLSSYLVARQSNKHIQFVQSDQKLNNLANNEKFSLVCDTFATLLHIFSILHCICIALIDIFILVKEYIILYTYRK